MVPAAFLKATAQTTTRGTEAEGPALQHRIRAHSGLRSHNRGPRPGGAWVPSGHGCRSPPPPAGPGLAGSLGPLKRGHTPHPPRAPANGHLLAGRARRPARPPLPATCHAAAATGRIARARPPPPLPRSRTAPAQAAAARARAGRAQPLARRAGCSAPAR